MLRRKTWLILLILVLIGGGIVVYWQRDRLLGDSLISTSSTAYTETQILSSKPPGPYINLTADQIPKGFSAEQPLSATYYFYWYDYASKTHFVDKDGSDALTDHPVNPETYSWKDERWHAKQLEDMIYSGIDVVLPDYWGTPADSIMNIPANREKEGLPALTKAIDSLTESGKTAPKISLFYDTSTLKYNAAQYQVDLSTAAGRAWFYVSIRDFFSLIPPRDWATIGGQPLVFIYSATLAANGTNDNQLLDYVRSHFKQDFGGAVPYIVADATWINRWPNLRWDNYYAWGSALYGLKTYGVASLGPGYDDSAVPGRTPRKADRQDGELYRRNWTNLLKQDPARRPKIVTVETWNEFHEGSEIAESVEYGRKYLDMTKDFIALWKTGVRLERNGNYTAKGLVEATLGEHGVNQGISLNKTPDGNFANIVAGDKEGVVTVANSAGGAKYLYFGVDDSFFFDDLGPVEVTIEYFDEGKTPVDWQYDSGNTAASGWGAYKKGGTISRQNSLTWKQATFKITDARFINRQNGLSDFRFLTWDSLKVHQVIVRKLYLIFTKEASTTIVNKGGSITYTMIITNPTTDNFSNAVVSDNLPAGTSYVAGTASDGGRYDATNKKITWQIPVVAGGQTVRRTFQVKSE